MDQYVKQDGRWGPCTIGDYCVHRYTPYAHWDIIGQALEMELTALGEPIHADCADTLVGAWVLLGHEVRAFGRLILASIRRKP